MFFRGLSFYPRTCPAYGSFKRAVWSCNDDQSQSGLTSLDQNSTYYRIHRRSWGNIVHFSKTTHNNIWSCWVKSNLVKSDKFSGYIGWIYASAFQTNIARKSVVINLFMPTSTFLYIFSRKIKSHPILSQLHIQNFHVIKDLKRSSCNKQPGHISHYSYNSLLLLKKKLSFLLGFFQCQGVRIIFYGWRFLQCSIIMSDTRKNNCLFSFYLIFYFYFFLSDKPGIPLSMLWGSVNRRI